MSMCCSYRGPGFDSHNHLFVTPVLRDLMPSSDLHVAPDIHIHIVCVYKPPIHIKELKTITKPKQVKLGMKKKVVSGSPVLSCGP